MSCRHSLLTLPREIRDEIYTVLLDTPKSPPASPAETGLRYQEAVDEIVFRHRCIFYPPLAAYKRPTSALSQCNRQTRHEIADFTTSTYFSRGETCELDVKLKSCMLWPTWTKLIHSPTKMEHLKVDLRLFDITRSNGLFWGSGGPGLTFVVLFRLLNRLLHHGPRFLYDNGDNQNVEIHTLTLNILPGYGEVLRSDDKMFRNRENPQRECEKLVNQEYQKIFQHIYWHMRQIVEQGLLSEKIHTVNVCYGDAVEVCDTTGITPNATPSDEWKRWRFIWGVDKGMKVEKTDCAAYLRRLHRLESGEDEEVVNREEEAMRKAGKDDEEEL
ncbi:MAG: hypothetical protein Q9169_003273 [Polycauliona sp. 2 TL-2023]